MITTGALDAYVEELLGESVMPSAEARATEVSATPAATHLPAPTPGTPPTLLTSEPGWDDVPDEILRDRNGMRPPAMVPVEHDTFPLAAPARIDELSTGMASIQPQGRTHAAPSTQTGRPKNWQELQLMARQSPEPAHQRRTSERTTRWLRLRCGSQAYALELLKVQEVVLPVPLLALRGANPSMLGIMNLRGQVVPVLDLCRHLDMASTPENAQTRIVVLEEGGEILGLRVTAVDDVTSLSDSQIEPPDTARICQISNELFRGVARLGQRPMILLDASRLLQ